MTHVSHPIADNILGAAVSAVYLNAGRKVIEGIRETANSEDHLSVVVKPDRVVLSSHQATTLERRGPVPISLDEPVITVSKEVAPLLERDGRPGVSESELKDALKAGRAVLSIADSHIAKAAAENMDKADGNPDGWVQLRDSVTVWGYIKGLFGGISGGASETVALAESFASGKLVIGRELQERAAALAKGVQILELRRVADGLYRDHFEIVKGY